MNWKIHRALELKIFRWKRASWIYEAQKAPWISYLRDIDGRTRLLLDHPSD
jgi:hypothetical protein